MLVQDIMNKVLVMIDNYTEDGVVVSEADNIDVEKKVILLTDMAQKENYRQNKITKQFEITTKPPENRMGDLSNFELVDYEGDTQYYPNESGTDDVQGYSIQVNDEASDNAVLTYQELIGTTWTTIGTPIAPTLITTQTTYKGVLLVSDTSNRVRLKIEGTHHFLHQNRALWKNLYKADKVPTYSPWVKYESIPDDFNVAKMVIEEYDNGIYSPSVNYKLENYNELYYSFIFNGRMRVTYYPIPVTITALTDTIQIDEILAQNIVYDICSKLGFYENPDLVNWAEGRRQEGKLDAKTDEPTSAEVMVDFYGSGSVVRR